MRARLLPRGAAAALLLALGGGPLAAFVLVRTQGVEGQPLVWRSSDRPVRFALNAEVESRVPGSEQALRDAFANWESAGAEIAFEEDTDPAVRALARTGGPNGEPDDHHLVFFDANNASGLFGAGPSGTIAITFLRFAGSGALLDADIVFNERDFAFSTTGQSNRMDVENIATHEVGHLLGLSHSPSLGATMFPFAEDGETLRRSLAQDDVQGVRFLYGAATAEPRGGLSGSVVHAGSGAAVAFAAVWAQDAFGRQVAGTLSDGRGRFAIDDLPPGVYRVLADPVDGPVFPGNLDPSAPFDTAFSTTFAGGNGQPTEFEVLPNGTTAVGAIEVGEPAANFDAQLTSPVVLRLPAGRSGLLQIASVAGGSVNNASAVSASHPNLTLTGVLGGPTIALNVAVAPGTPAGLYDLYLDRANGARTALAGVVEVTPSPLVASVFPPAGQAVGGTRVTICGEHFEPAATVRFGGVPASQIVVEDARTIRCTTPFAAVGPVVVLVSNPDLGRGEAPEPFTYVAGLDPTLSQALPPCGRAEGQDYTSLLGINFSTEAEVFFGVDPRDGSGGTPAELTVVATSEIGVLTPPGALGTTHVLVRNPDGTAVLAPVYEYVQGVLGGDRFAGTIAAAEQVDVLRVQLFRGATLDVQLRAGRNSALEPSLEIRDESGVVRLSSVSGATGFDPAFFRVGRGKLALKAWPAPSMGSFDLLVGGASGTSGTYELSLRTRFFKEDLRSVFPPTPLGSGLPLLLPVAGTISGTVQSSGVRLDPYMELRIGSFVAFGLLANSHPSLTLSEDGTVVRMKKLQLPGTFGVHSLVLFPATDGAGGTVSGSYQIRAGKGRSRYLEVGR